MEQIFLNFKFLIGANNSRNINILSIRTNSDLIDFLLKVRKLKI